MHPVQAGSKSCRRTVRLGFSKYCKQIDGIGVIVLLWDDKSVFPVAAVAPLPQLPLHNNAAVVQFTADHQRSPGVQLYLCQVSPRS